MNDHDSVRPAPRSAMAICERACLSDEARRLCRADLTPRRFLDRLLEEHLEVDAILLLPYCLPKRVAVWWGCLCAWQVYRPDPPEPAAAALQAAIHWVIDPSETNRQQGEVAGEAAGLTTAAGALAVAAFWSGGSMSRPDLPAVPPPDDLTAQAVGGAVLLAAVEREPLEHRQHYRQFLALGLEVAGRSNLWTLSGSRSAQRTQDGDSPTNGERQRPQPHEQRLVAAGS